MEQTSYPLMEIARLGALFLPGDRLEEVMPPDRREYPLRVAGHGRFALGDEVDFAEEPFNTLKRVLLLTERIDPARNPYTALWIKRPENPSLVEVMVAGRALPAQGYQIQEPWPEILPAFDGTPAEWSRDGGQTIYYPIRNSDEEIIGVLEVTEHIPPLFI